MAFFPSISLPNQFLVIWAVIMIVVASLLGALMTFLFFLFLDFNNPPSSIYNTTYLPALQEAGLTGTGFESAIQRFFLVFPIRKFLVLLLFSRRRRDKSKAD